MERPETGFASKKYLKLVGVSAHGEAVVVAGEELLAAGWPNDPRRLPGTDTG